MADTGSASSSRPRLMMPIQSARRSTSSMSCDEMNTVQGRSPPATSRMPCENSSRTSASRPANGSSITSSSGRYASDTTSAAFIFMPREQFFSGRVRGRSSCASSASANAASQVG